MRDDRFGTTAGGLASEPGESWLFAQELLGRPVCRPPEPRAETAAEREQREWVEAITDRDRSPWPVAPALISKPIRLPTPPAETAAERELREWVESISNLRERTWDSSKHPRGGFPENPGWFSPSGGGGGGVGSLRDNDGSARRQRIAGSPRSWHDLSQPGQTGHDNHSPSSSLPKAAGGDAKQGQMLAQKVIKPGTKPAASQPQPQWQNFVFGRPFGQFPDRVNVPIPKGATTVVTPPGDPNVELLRAQTEAHLRQQVPQEVRDALANGGVKTLYTDSLARHRSVIGNASVEHVGGRYVPTAGTVFVPHVLPNGQPNTFVQNNTRHEVGHAFDDMTNGSLSPQFLAAYRNDIKAIPRSQRAGHPPIKQFVPETYENPPLNLPHAEAEHWAAREAFAQSFADATAPNGALEHDPARGMSQPKEFRRLFKNTNDHMKKQFLPTFIAQQRQRQQQQPPPGQIPPRPPRP